MQLRLKMDSSHEFDQLSTCFSEVMKPSASLLQESSFLEHHLLFVLRKEHAVP